MNSDAIDFICSFEKKEINTFEKEPLALLLFKCIKSSAIFPSLILPFEKNPIYSFKVIVPIEDFVFTVEFSSVN
mgnify:CR=1 FL=1